MASIAENAVGMRERLRSRRASRLRRRAAGVARREAGRTVVGKAIAVAVLLVLFFALAFIVGDGDSRATVVGWAPPVAILTSFGLAYGYLQLVKRNLRFSDEPLVSSCQRDSGIRFSVRFSNPLPVFIFKLDAHLVIADAYGDVANTTATTLTLAPYESQSFGFTMHFDHIGTYEAGLERVVVSDFLGLFTATLENGSRTAVDVTPRLHPIGGIRFSNDALMEASRAAKSVLADSMDYAYAREYASGDPLKTIHWKLSARSDHYMTRLYETYTNPGVCIVLDFYGKGEDAEQLMTMFDTVVEAGFSIADYSRSCGFDTEMRFAAKDGTHRVLRRWSVGEMPGIVEEMPVLSNRNEDKTAGLDVVAEQVSESRGQNNLVICTANIDSDMVSLVLSARARQRAPLLVAVVPAGLTGRERDGYCKPLARLDAVDAPYVVIAHASDLSEVRP